MPHEEVPLECLQSALLRLVTHYAMRPSADNATAVARILSELAGHPAAPEQPLFHSACTRALIHWRQLAAAKMFKNNVMSTVANTVH